MTSRHRKPRGLGMGPIDFDYAGAEAAAAKEAQEAADQEIDRRLAAISPCVRLLFDRVRAAIPQTLIHRLEAKKPAFIVVRVASDGWNAVAFEAVSMALEDVVRTEFMIYGVQYLHVPRDEIARRSWQRKNQRDKSEQVFSMLSSGITVVTLAPGEELDPAILVIADMTLDLTRIESADVETAITHAFPGSSCKWPADVAVSEIEPRWIDIAIGRSVSADDALRMLAAVNGRPKAASKGPKLEDLHGYGSAQAWGLRLAAALCEYRAGTRTWSDVDAGALLVGPPGTGKTLFASALAESCGVAFVATSYSAWQSEGEGHLGTVTRAIRKTFSEAAAAAPCIVFIDEIDSLPARGSGTRHDDWWQTIVNNLLECLDGTGRREGVIVLAACNDDRTLDSALVRSGRLDRRFHIGLPNEDDLLQILRHHLPTIPEADIQPAAVTLTGSASGADAARIARDVRQLARSERREPSGADLLKVALPPDDRSPRLRLRIAVHEAGHAVAVMRQGQVPSCLSIVSRDGGHVTHERVETEQLLDDLDAQLAVTLAGRAAEEVVFGTVSAGAGGPDSSDLGRATQLVALIEGRYGLGFRLGVVEKIDETLVERRLRIAYADALLAAMRDRCAIEALAEQALEARVLGRTALAEFWSRNGAQPPRSAP